MTRWKKRPSAFERTTTSRFTKDPPLDLGTLPDGKPFLVPLSEFDYHHQVVGTTGAGKSYYLRRLFQELAQKSKSAVVLLDPKGDMYDHLARWSFQKSYDLDKRLILIDPSQSERIAGVNPLNPWASDLLEAQANVAAALIMRAMGIRDPLSYPQVYEWFAIVHHLALELGLNYIQLRDFVTDPAGDFGLAATAAVQTPHLSAELNKLQDLEEQRGAGAARMVFELLGPVKRRLKPYLAHPTVSLMLSSPASIDWDEVIDEKKIVLINLQRMDGFEGIERRLFGLQVTTELIRAAFRRKEKDRKPCYLMMDEAQYFVSDDMEEILREGRGYKLRLILAHQDPSQFGDQDSSLYRLVKSCTAAKAVFQLGSYQDAQELAQDLYGHLYDPFRVKQEIVTKRQLSEEVYEDKTTTHEGRTASYNADGEPIGTTDSGSETTSGGWRTRPGEVFEETRLEFMSLAEQLYEDLRELRQKTPAEGVFGSWQRKQPTDFTTSHFQEPTITQDRLPKLIRRLTTELQPQYYLPPAEIRAAIAANTQRVIEGPVVEATPMIDDENPEEGPD